jgi:hypothetical protein
MIFAELSSDYTALALVVEGGIFVSLAVAVRIAQRLRRPRGGSRADSED